MNPLLSHEFPGIQETEKSIMVETVINAMEELLELFQENEPLWVKSPTNERYLIHCEIQQAISQNVPYQ